MPRRRRVAVPSTIDRIRADLGLGLRDLARQLDVSPALLCQINSGQRRMSPRVSGSLVTLLRNRMRSARPSAPPSEPAA